MHIKTVVGTVVLLAGVLAGCGGDEEKCAVLATSFPEDTTLPKGCYLARETPTIGDGVTLTLQAGVEIIFSSDVGLDFTAGQTFVAAGTERDPILLTGEEPQRGFWRGLRFDMADGDSRLEYTTVEYAGSTTAENDPDAAAVKLTSDTRPVRLSISHSTLRESQGWGLWLTTSAELARFEANTLTANTLGPVSLNSGLVGLLDAASTYQGNDVDQITVRCDYLQQNADWATLDVPYFLDGDLRVETPWTIAAGATLILTENAWIFVANDEAALHAVGTEELPIRITGAEPTPGYWKALVFDNSNNAANAFDHAIIEYGGAVGGTGEQGMITAQSDSHGVTLSITNSVLQGSAECAIWLGQFADYNGDIATSNTFADDASEVCTQQ